MDLTISRPVKILLLVLVLAGVGGIASLTMLGKSSPASSAAPIPTAAQLRAQRAAAAAHKPATTAAATTPATKAPAPVHKAAAPKPKPAPKPQATTAPNGLPIVLFDALRAHPVVVVSVFDPQSQTDAVAYAEARAGAADAHAGFLGVSVLDDSVAGPLTAALPDGQLLPLPGVLVFRRPGVLIERIDGFSDRDSVAALAAASLTAAPYTPPPSATATTAAVASAPAPAPAPTTTTTP